MVRVKILRCFRLQTCTFELSRASSRLYSLYTAFVAHHMWSFHDYVFNLPSPWLRCFDGEKAALILMYKHGVPVPDPHIQYMYLCLLLSMVFRIFDVNCSVNIRLNQNHQKSWFKCMVESGGSLALDPFLDIYVVTQQKRIPSWECIRIP